MPRPGNLGAAHRGYLYQDVTTAFAFAQALATAEDSVTVDRKLVPGDIFDDLTVRNPSGTVRRQLKWSNEGTRQLILRDFVHDGSGVRIDKLVRSHMQTRGDGPHEFRLAVAWAAPAAADVVDVLVASNAAPLIPGSTTQRFCLDPDAVWPAGGDAQWAPLRPRDDEPELISREDFLAFAADFVLETDTPPFSADLTRPGPLETLLLRFLVERIGIGEYPNERRTKEDVAARLITAAARARTEHATLAAGEIARAIDLQVDFGQIAQRFPILIEHRVDREGLRGELLRALDTAAVVTLVGPPGSGKSWELTSLADELRGSGRLVARHYCYVEPGDPGH